MKYRARNTVKLARERHEKKIADLAVSQGRPLASIERSVVLLDDIKPPQFVLELLSKGPKYLIGGKFERHHFFAEVNRFLEKLVAAKCDPSVVNRVNAHAVLYAQKCNRRFGNRLVKKVTSYLKENGIVAVPFDKGLGFCLMKQESYFEKINALCQGSQFQIQKNDRVNAKHPSLREQERFNKVLLDLRKNDAISDGWYQQCRSTGGQIAKLYGLAKVHKKNIPVRPIVSMPGTCYNALSKKIAGIMSKVPECNIQTRPHLVAGELSQVNLPPGHELVSLDVTSLFTMVPVDEATSLAAKKVSENGLLPDTMTEETFLLLLRLCVKNVLFVNPDGCLFRQTDGVAMGSALGPYLANIFMSQFDATLAQGKPFYYRYVDDILTAEAPEKIEELLKLANGLHPSLSFTNEREDNGSLSFLDIRVSRVNSVIRTSWYQKQTDTGICMNFLSVAPTKYKASVVCGLVHRVFRSCSTWLLFDNCLKHALQMLESNQYPPAFYHPLVRRTIAALWSGSPNNEHLKQPRESACPKVQCFLTYHGVETMNFVKKFSNQIQFILTTEKLRKYVSSLKCPVPKLFQSNVVYCITCSGCDALYVGQTSRHLTTRLDEHSRKGTPVATHFEQCGVPRSEIRRAVTLLDRSLSIDSLLTLEALYISEMQPSINTKEEFRSKTLLLRMA